MTQLHAMIDGLTHPIICLGPDIAMACGMVLVSYVLGAVVPPGKLDEALDELKDSIRTNIEKANQSLRDQGIPVPSDRLL